MKIARQFARRWIDRLQYTRHDAAEMVGSGGSAWCLIGSILETRTTPVLFSGGVGKNISFELEFARRFRGRVYLYDPSPTGVKTAELIPAESPIEFYPKGLAGSAGRIEFETPKNPDEGSWTAPGGGSGKFEAFDTLSLVQEISGGGYSHVDVVKLDIEGFEYDVIEKLLEADHIVVDQIAVEFHDFFPSVDKSKSIALRKRLRDAGYRCFYKSKYDFGFVRRELW